MIGHEHVFELVPLHALDALEDEERRQVDAHLEMCDVCSAELDRHRSVTSTLAPDTPAPEHVWARIEAGIDEDQTSNIVDLAQVSAKRAKPLVWIASVAALAAVVLGGVVLGQLATINDLTGPRAVISAAETAASEPGSIVEDFVSDGVTVAEVILTPEGEGFVLPKEGLELLGSGRTYQLWVITSDQQVISAGALGNRPSPSRFTWTGDVSGFALTREVAGGVEKSAGDVVAVVET